MHPNKRFWTIAGIAACFAVLLLTIRFCALGDSRRASILSTSNDNMSLQVSMPNSMSALVTVTIPQSFGVTFTITNTDGRFSPNIPMDLIEAKRGVLCNGSKSVCNKSGCSLPGPVICSIMQNLSNTMTTSFTIPYVASGIQGGIVCGQFRLRSSNNRGDITTKGCTSPYIPSSKGMGSSVASIPSSKGIEGNIASIPSSRGMGSSVASTRLSNCGNGNMSGKGCDDGNQKNGDGCNSVCKVEAGWKCTTISDYTSHCWKCGNGNIEIPEKCDDGATVNNDGCSSMCYVENGWICSGKPSTCVKK